MDLISFYEGQKSVSSFLKKQLKKMFRYGKILQACMLPQGKNRLF